MRYIIARFRLTDEGKEYVSDNSVMQDAIDVLCSIAGDAGFESFEYSAHGVIGYIQESIFNSELLEQSLDEWPYENIKVEYSVEEMESRDWNETWEENGFEPIEIDNRIIIYDARKSDEYANNSSDSLIKIGIEAVNSFGTGTHETTRMVIHEMINTDLTGKRVLDCGCGTGILSIVASKLGARHVVGYDIDDFCVENTKHNANINNVDNIEVMLGDTDITSNISEPFDIILANLNRNIILASIKQWLSLTKRYGMLIISGFYVEDIDTLSKAISDYDLETVNTASDNSWACMVLKRKN